MIYNLKGKTTSNETIIFSLSDGVNFNPSEVDIITVDKSKVLFDSIQLGFNLGDIFYNEVFVGDIVSTVNNKLYYLDFIDFIGCVFKDLNTHEIVDIGNNFWIFSDNKQIEVPTNPNYKLPSFLYFSKVFTLHDLRWSNEQGVMVTTNHVNTPVKLQYVNQIVTNASGVLLAAGHKNCRMKRGKIIK